MLRTLHAVYTQQSLIECIRWTYVIAVDFNSRRCEVHMLFIQKLYIFIQKYDEILEKMTAKIFYAFCDVHC